MTNRLFRGISCIAAIVLVTASLSVVADAKPGKGGSGGGPPHGGGGGGGAPRGGGGMHMGAPQGGPRQAIPHAAPRQIHAPRQFSRSSMPHGPAARAFHAPRLHAGPRIRSARPAFQGRASVARVSRSE